MQEGAWSMHVSKFFYLIQCHIFYAYAWFIANLTCNIVQVAMHKVL